MAMGCLPTPVEEKHRHAVRDALERRLLRVLGRDRVVDGRRDAPRAGLGARERLVVVDAAEFQALARFTWGGCVCEL